MNYITLAFSAHYMDKAVKHNYGLLLNIQHKYKMLQIKPSCRPVYLYHSSAV